MWGQHATGRISILTEERSPSSVDEKALSKGDLVYTDDNTRTTRGMGGSNTLYERVGLLHATSARPGVGRARWLLKTSRTASASCHGSGDPVGCRSCLSRRRVRRRHPAASPVV